ncbi:MAG: hypothetical protein HY241_15795 [Actinobacteria bacterium]|nr:hypothetical protein [Actinomycetota bacterium]
MSSGPRQAPRSGWWADRTDRTDLLGWLGLAGAGLAASWLASQTQLRVGTASPPFSGSYLLRVGPPSLLAPAVAAVVLVAAARSVTDRWPWRMVLLGSYLAATAWALALALADGRAGLAAPVNAPEEYLADLDRVNGGPLRYLQDFVADGASLTVATRSHPPLPLLLLWLLERVGVRSPLALGVVLTMVASLTVPAVLVAVRSLCGGAAARQLAPVLALAPYAVWVAVSMDGVTAALAAGSVTAAVIGSEHGRRWWVSLTGASVAGLLLGVAALFSYSVAWLAVSVMCVYFVRRRPLLNVVTAAFALLPLALAELAGFSWPAGLAAAQRDVVTRIAPHRSALLWGLLGLAVLVLACGPALVRSARRVRATPGWPFLVGAAAGVAFAVLAGLARSDVERSWLPFFPWLLVASVAPVRPAGEPPPAPIWLIAAGALTGVVIQAVLVSPW